MARRFTETKLQALRAHITNPDELAVLLESDDPVVWAETHLNDPDTGEKQFRVKKVFYDVLRDPIRDRALRTGRQLGKTVHLCVDILHTLLFNRHYVILIFVPEKKHMNRMLEIMSNLLRVSPLKSAYTMGKAGRKGGDGMKPEYDYEIQCASGSVARFFFVSANVDKCRGQFCKGALYMDECEYFPKKAWPVITGILKSAPETCVWASSTPSGFEGTWFREFSERCASAEHKDGHEYHLPSRLEENWPEIEERLRAVIFDDVTWQLEVEAEWADAKGAVYKKEIINRALERSLQNGVELTADALRHTLEYRNATKILGVDWNEPQNGVRLVEITELAVTGMTRPWLTRHEIISYEQYTQHNAVDRIMALYTENHYVKIAVDAGYGETQIEMIHKALLAMGKDPKDILHVVNANTSETMTITYTSPLSGARRTEEIKIRTKDKLVGLVTKYLEGTLTLLYEEDRGRAGLVRELRNFRRKNAVGGGGFVYSENTHSLSAFQICLHGYDAWLSQGTPRQIDQAIMSSADLSAIIKRSREREVPMMSGLSNRQLTRTAGLRHGGSRRSLI